MKRFLFFCIFMFFFGYLVAEEVPRKVVVFYGSQWEEKPVHTLIYRLIEMPLNHLGLIAEYHDCREELPDVKDDPEVRGVVTCWLPGKVVKDPEAYLKWAIEILRSGKKFVVIGDPGFYKDQENNYKYISLFNHFWREMGLRDEDNWIDITYNCRYHQIDPRMIGFERPLPSVIPEYPLLKVFDQ